MSNPWGGLGSWAAESERAEAEERELNSAAAAANSQSFPSLKEASAAKPKKKKMTLSEFASYGSTSLTPDEMLQLPTAPKPRTSDEFSGGPRLGGGFSNYGGGDDRRRGPPPRRGPDLEMPSRADEVDNWASMKRPVSIPPPESSRSSRYGSLGGGSRADDMDNWNLGKKQPSIPQVGSRSSTFGSGFRDSGSNWRRGEEGERETGRPRLVLDPPSGNNDNVVKKTTNRANPFGAARPREEVLAEKGLDWKKMDLEIEAKKASESGGSSRPTSSQGSRPTSSQSNRSESVGGFEGVKPRPKVNPFGDAKPREVLLEEKGMDWRKMDLELDHRRVDRPETEEEKALKEEIENLRKELEKDPATDVSQGFEGEKTTLHHLIQSKERGLEALIRELDDKVRFGQKAVERPRSRPGSGAGRYTSFPDRPPPSQAGSFDEVRGAEAMDRPRSRGTGDVWTRPGEDRRGFQSGRDRGFTSNSDFDRLRARGRW